MESNFIVRVNWIGNYLLTWGKIKTVIIDVVNEQNVT